MATNSSNQNLKALTVVAILALLGANIFQFVTNNSLKQDNIHKETEIMTLDSAKAALDKQYQESIAELNAMKTDNEELNKSIEVQKEELRLQKDKITILLKDSKNLKAAKNELATMKSKLDEYVAEINKLKFENKKLDSSNQELNTQKVNLSKDLEKKGAENQKLEAANSSLSNEKAELNKTKEDLSRRYNRAAAIQLFKLDATGYQNREGKKPSSKSKAADVNFIEVCFKTSENKNADAGNEKFYIRIINPLGETETAEGQGTGMITNNATNSEIKYSCIANVDYKNDEQKSCGKFNNSGALTKGIYQIEIYNKGYLVGTTTLKLK